MLSLSPADSHHLRAAEGWLMLGNNVEANAELEQLAANLRVHPNVLDLRWHIYRDAKNWEACFATAAAMMESVPKDPQGWLSLAQTFYFTKRFQEAFDLVLSKIPSFPTHWSFYYDAACYACHLGKLAQAQEFLHLAFAFGNANEVSRMAQDDPDLQVLRPERKVC